MASLAINQTDRNRGVAVVILHLPFTAGVLIESGFMPPALVYLADLPERHVTDRGVIMGLCSLLLGLGQSGSAWLGGTFAAWASMDGIILLAVLFGLISLITVLHTPHPPGTIA